jgi:hypothetical protein
MVEPHKAHLCNPQDVHINETIATPMIKESPSNSRKNIQIEVPFLYFIVAIIDFLLNYFMEINTGAGNHKSIDQYVMSSLFWPIFVFLRIVFAFSSGEFFENLLYLAPHTFVWGVWYKYFR